MSEQMERTVTPEEILRNAHGQINALGLAIIAYLKQHDLPVTGFWNFLGSRIAGDRGSEQTPIEFLQREAKVLPYAFGCRVLSISGDSSQAQAVVAPWPADAAWSREGFLSLFGLSQEEADLFWETYRPIADHMGFDYQWERKGDEVRVSFSKPTA